MATISKKTQPNALTANNFLNFCGFFYSAMIITKSELFNKLEKYARLVFKGAIFVHPTDTINGLGCDATHDEAVKKLRKIKNSHSSPFSVILPSKDWIRENCELNEEAKRWLKKLPGPYTLVLKLRNRSAVSRYVNPNDNTIGVRIPDHWISEFVSYLDVPIVTTSPNPNGEDYTDDIEELHPLISNNVNFIVYDSSVGSKPSDIVILTGKKPKIIKRSR